MRLAFMPQGSSPVGAHGAATRTRSARARRAVERVVAVEDARRRAARRRARRARRAAPRARSPRRARARPSAAPAPLSTALGCISHAAAAISTLSGTPRSRPPANAWRNAASENGDGAPDLRGVGRDAHRERACRRETARGQRSGCRPRRAATRSMRSKNASRSVSQRKPSSVSAPGRSGALTGIHSARPAAAARTRSAARYASGLKRSK